MMGLSLASERLHRCRNDPTIPSIPIRRRKSECPEPESSAERAISARRCSAQHGHRPAGERQDRDHLLPAPRKSSPVAEKMITLGKTGRPRRLPSGSAPSSRRKMSRSKLFKELAPKYADRNGGYTSSHPVSALAAATLPRWPSSSWCKRIPVYRCRMQDILQRFFYVRVSAINATSLCTVFHKTHCINC